MLHVITAIYGIGAFQAFLFTMLLVTKKEKKKADKFLAGFFFVITVYFVNLYSYTMDLWIKWPDLMFIITLVPLTYGPLLYFYVLSLLRRSISVKQIVFHAIPIIGTYMIILPFIFHTKDEKSLYFTDKFMNLPLYVSIGIFIQYLSAPIYFTWIILILKKHKKLLKENISTIDRNNLNWMRILLFVVITVWMIDCINVYALNYTNLNIPYITSLYIKVVFISAIVILGFYGMKQAYVFVPSNNQDMDENKGFKKHIKQPISDEIAEENVSALAEHLLNGEENSIRIKDIAENLNLPVHVLSYIINVKLNNQNKLNQTENKKLIPDKLADEYKDVLIKYMTDNKTYLNSELRVQDISIGTNIPPHIISYVLNKKLNQNFFDFVNEFRIDEVKTRLQDSTYNNFTIMAIAFDCGFNSKATFNRLFKKYTGTTPSQFKK